VAELLVTVATDERAWGRPWHVPGAPALTQRETVAVLAAAAGRRDVKVSVPPAFVLRLAGLVVPTVRELRETSHQFARDWVLDGSQAERTFGLRATPLAESAAATVAWYRHGPAREAVPA